VNVAQDNMKKVIEYETCPNCNGRGIKWYDAHDCTICDGEGRVVKKEEIVEEDDD